jgi:hypothetical protein
MNFPDIYAGEKIISIKIKIMRIYRNLKSNQQGFTTFELIVAIQLSLLVIGLIYVSFIFATKLTNKWQDKVYVENNLSLVSITLSKSLDEVETIYVAETNEFVGLKQNGDSLHIYLSEYVFLNGEIMGDSTLRLTSGRINYLLPPADGSSDLITASGVGGLQLDDIRIIQLQLFLERNKKQYPLEVLCRPLKLKRSIVQ